MKTERDALVDMEHIVQELQTFQTVQRIRRHTEAFEVIEDIRLHTLQAGLCGFQGLRFNAEGEELGLDKAVIASGKLILQHTGVLGTNGVEVVTLQGNADAAGIGVLRRGHIYEGELELD